MRILLVSHSPLVRELGAAQTTIGLADGLRELGHDVTPWQPVTPPGTRLRPWREQARLVRDYLAAHGPFDFVDTPASTAGPGLPKGTRLVVRSIQPELHYLVAELRDILGSRPTPRSLARSLPLLTKAGAIVAGWRRAHLLLSMGEIERAWMARTFPGWRRKLSSYVCASSPQDRALLLATRAQRTPAMLKRDYLWIGRWSRHKGIHTLTRFMSASIDANSRTSFTLAGYGPVAPSLPERWLNAGNVKLLPSYSRDELPNLLASHRAGLFTSSVEGWGLSLTEMLEAGLPVYATAAGGVLDLEPFFPEQLQRFPPPALPQAAPPAPLSTAYLSRFNWSAIAEDYLSKLGASTAP